MIKLSELLDRNCVRLEMKSARKKDAVAELLDMASSAGYITDKKGESLLREIMEREKTSSTGIGDGIAIPHRLVEGLDRSVMAFGRKREGINFDSIDGRPATLFFLLLGRHGDHAAHLRILSKLARLLHDPAFREKLNSAQTADDVIRSIREQEEE